jgi:Ice-binding-like/Bacterial Ig-like domain
VKKFLHSYKYPTQLMVLLACAASVGCDSGHWDRAGGIDPIIPAAPTVATMLPMDAAINVPVNYTLSVNFSEAMDAATINSTTFTVTDSMDMPVLGNVVYNSTTNTATFSPLEQFDANETYTARINTGAEDATGQALTEAEEWMFTTSALADSTGPMVTSTNPVDLAMGVCSNRTISIQFNETVNPLTFVTPSDAFTLVETNGGAAVDGEISFDDTGTMMIFTSANLMPMTDYTATLGTSAEDLAGNFLAAEEEWAFATGEACQDALVLEDTATFGVLSNTGVTLGGGPNSVTGFRVIGDVGISPGALIDCVGCDTTTVDGEIQVGNVVASDAMDEVTTLYNDAAARSENLCTLVDAGSLATNPSLTCGGNLDGVFYPGLYWSATSITIPAGATITLDAQNDPDAVFIFQSESTIGSIGGDTHIVLANGAQAKNVFWLAKSSATIGGTNSDFAGTVIAQSAITVNTGTEMIGRAFARTASVTIQDGASITVPAQ